MMTLPLMMRGAPVMVAREPAGMVLHLPDRLAGGGVERHQSAIQRAQVQPALPGGQAAIDHVTAGIDAGMPRHLGVIAPFQRAGRGIQREHAAPGGRHIHHPIDDQRRRLLRPRIHRQIKMPGGLQARDIAGVDLLQRTEAMLIVGAAVGEPVVALATRRPAGARHPPACGCGTGAGGRRRADGAATAVRIVVTATGEQHQAGQGNGASAHEIPLQIPLDCVIGV